MKKSDQVLAFLFGAFCGISLSGVIVTVTATILGYEQLEKNSVLTSVIEKSDGVTKSVTKAKCCEVRQSIEMFEPGKYVLITEVWVDAKLLEQWYVYEHPEFPARCPIPTVCTVPEINDKVKERFCKKGEALLKKHLKMIGRDAEN